MTPLESLLYTDVYDAIKRFLGRKLKAVELNKTRGRVTFVFQDGERTAFDVEGECCSSSWIEHLEMPPNINGATVLDASDANVGRDEVDGDTVLSYRTVIRTDRGDIVLEYRNSSNGYYGGYLVLAKDTESQVQP